jgi:Ca2+-binding EF-hand superfamily protein
MLTDLQRRKLTHYFRVYDVDDDGRIGPLDFARITENVRILNGYKDGSTAHQDLRTAFQERWEALRSVADLDHDGTVDLDEWLQYWDGVVSEDDRYHAQVAVVADRLFENFDIDEDGVIGVDEFCDFFAVYGMRAAVARQVFVDLDSDGDGRISRDEFLEMASQFYRSDEPEAPGNRLFGPY